MLRSSLRLTLALLFAGCYSPGLYSAPRTLDPGSFVVGGHAEIASRISVGGTPIERLVPFPYFTYMARLGVLPRLELAGSYTFPYSGTLGLKLNVIRTETIDVGFAGRFAGQALFGLLGYMGSCPGTDPPHCEAVYHLQSELIPMLGLNVADDWTLILSGGGRLEHLPHPRQGYRITIGVQWRPTNIVAIQPEITYLPDAFAGVADANRGLFGGLTFAFRGADGYPKKTMPRKTP
jgi:hypothetical protein